MNEPSRADFEHSEKIIGRVIPTYTYSAVKGFISKALAYQREELCGKGFFSVRNWERVARNAGWKSPEQVQRLLKSFWNR